MNDFSATQNAGDDALPCQQANLFYLGRLPEGCSLDLTGCVNGRQTPMLTPGETYQLPNTLPGTVNRLELMVDGKPHVITEDIRQMAHIGRPEDLKVAVGTAPPPARTTGDHIARVLCQFGGRVGRSSCSKDGSGWPRLICKNAGADGQYTGGLREKRAGCHI